MYQKHVYTILVYIILTYNLTNIYDVQEVAVLLTPNKAYISESLESPYEQEDRWR